MRTLETARGYIGLGMIEEAKEEISSLNAYDRENLSVIKIQIEIHLQKSELSHADMLLSATSSECRRDAEWQFLRARYFARSLNYKEANRHLMKAIMLHDHPTPQLLEHPDLQQIWEWTAN
ncbi:MAG: hypothetical protein AAF984_02120 [Verrucomicrobiota bacterium]